MDDITMPHSGDRQLVPLAGPHHISTATPSFFERLPADIWIEILKQFCDHCRDPTCENPSQDLRGLRKDSAALSALSKTCKWLRDAVQPVLFHQFPLFKYLRGTFDPTERLYYFVRTLVERPDLAAAVRSLRLLIWVGNSHGRYFPLPRYIACDHRSLGQINRTACRLGLIRPPPWLPGFSGEFDVRSTDNLGNNARVDQERDDEWWQKFTDEWHGDIEDCQGLRHMMDNEGSAFLVQLAVRLCENARTIDLCPLPRHEPEVFYGFFATLAEKPHAFNADRLRILGDQTPAWGGRMADFNIRQLANLGKSMPKLRTLQLHFAYLADRDWWDRNNFDVERTEGGWDLNASLLTRLELVFSTVSEGRLATMLSGCQSLTDFTYISMPADLIMSNYHHGIAAHPHKVTDILNNRCPNLRKTLRRVTLEHFQTIDLQYRGAYSSLRNLTALEEVRLGASGLFIAPEDLHRVMEGVVPVSPEPLARILPPNLRALDIIMAEHWQERTAAAILQLLEHIQTTSAVVPFGGLKEIRVWLDLPFFPFTLERLRTDIPSPNWWSFMDLVSGQKTDWEVKVAGLATKVGIKLSVMQKRAPDIMELPSITPEGVLDEDDEVWL